MRKIKDADYEARCAAWRALPPDVKKTLLDAFEFCYSRGLCEHFIETYKHLGKELEKNNAHPKDI